jgi:hypothetical protein
MYVKYKINKWNVFLWKLITNDDVNEVSKFMASIANVSSYISSFSKIKLQTI